MHSPSTPATKAGRHSTEQLDDEARRSANNGASPKKPKHADPRSLKQLNNQEEIPINPGMPLDLSWALDVHINATGTQRDALDITSRRSVKKEWQTAWDLKTITLIDLTTLSGDDSSASEFDPTPGNVEKLCGEALNPLPATTLAQLKAVGLDIHTGAVCIYHNHVAAAVAALQGTGLPVAAVSTGFPHAQNPFEQRVEEIERSVADGATEIVVVITREHVLRQIWQHLYDEIRSYRVACGSAHMKTIFETGEVGTMENVAKASRIAMQAGSDFIKTSTGKATHNANLAVSLVMLRQIREFYETYGIMVGFKPAGGIATAKDSRNYIELVKNTLGDAWLNPRLFRIGASSLLKDLKKQLWHRSTNHYAETDYAEQREISFSAATLDKVKQFFGTMEYGLAPEAEDEALAWLKLHNNTFGQYIDGKFVKGGSDKTFDVVCPADGRILAKFYHSTKEDVDAAVAAALKAQKIWAALPPFRRSQFLYAVARGVQDNLKLLSVLESLNNGKPFREAYKVDIPLCARHFRYHAGMAQIAEQKFPDHEPYGVCGQIIPWNFPTLMLGWKFGPALAAGCAVVLKPASLTPLTAMLICEICRDAALQTGVPPAIVNVVNGRGGYEITKHPEISKLAFTGSTGVGRELRKTTAGSGKGLTLELGGKSPVIVFEDADLDVVTEGLVNAIWFNQGSVCCGGSRLLVQETVYERLVTKLKARITTLRVGHSLDKCIDMGAIVDKGQLKTVIDMVQQAADTGCEVFKSDQVMPANGFFHPPTLITGCDPTSRIVQEEVFGPVLAVMTFRTHDEAVKLANNTVFGLACSIWTEKLEKANEVAARVQAGVIWINAHNIFDATGGFGGYKESGFGREGGSEGMKAYLKPVVPDAGAADTTVPSGLYDDVVPQAIDQTQKLYIGGKQVRSDSGYSQTVVNPSGAKVGDVAKSNRKDIRDAVKAAQSALPGWSSVTPDTKSQILHFTAENLSKRSDEFAARLVLLTGCTPEAAKQEVDLALEALFSAAAWSDKYEGFTHQPPSKRLIPTLHEPMGIIGITCPNENPLLSFVTMVAAAIAMGNTIVVVPSEKYPLLATDFIQILATSDVPGGVVNIVTGQRDVLSLVLAEHDSVHSVWYHGSLEGSVAVERAIGDSNLKQSWVNCGKATDWGFMARRGMFTVLLPKATQVKNIWVPWGEGTGPA